MRRGVGYGHITVYRIGGWRVTQKPYSLQVDVFAPGGRLVYSERPGKTITERYREKLVEEIKNAPEI